MHATCSLSSAINDRRDSGIERIIRHAGIQLLNMMQYLRSFNCPEGAQLMHRSNCARSNVFHRTRAHDLKEVITYHIEVGSRERYSSDLQHAVGSSNATAHRQIRRGSLVVPTHKWSKINLVKGTDITNSRFTFAPNICDSALAAHHTIV